MITGTIVQSRRQLETRDILLAFNVLNVDNSVLI
jgi:hypothetical protein